MGNAHRNKKKFNHFSPMPEANRPNKKQLQKMSVLHHLNIFLDLLRLSKP
jgi:hypothetical protein